MEKKLQHSYHGTAALTTWLKMMKYLLLVSVRRENPREIFRVFVSKSSALREFPFLLSSQERRRRNDPCKTFFQSPQSIYITTSFLQGHGYYYQYYSFVCYFLLLIPQMARRQVSPLRAPILRSEVDPRDNMIRKLKEDLIVARGRQKELAILEHYLVQLIEKTKLLTAQLAKSDQEGKLKLQLTIKSINQLKKQVDILRAELKSITNQLGVVEEEEIQLKKILNSRVIEIEKLKKEGISLHQDNEKLLNQHYRLRSQEDETVHEIKKLSETIRNYQGRLSEINRKIIQVKAYINEISQENLHLREKLKGYERQNQGIDNDLDQKENRIDLLEKNFADNHEIIKNQVENYIELEHQNEKNIKQARHKANLVKIQNEKSNQLNAVIKKLQKNIGERSKDLSQVLADSSEINKINQDFAHQNTRLKQDLLYCQDHLQNLLKHNAFIQQEMQNYLREDEAIINIIRRKKLIPITNNYTSLRTSRNEAKNTNRTYQ